MHPIITLVTDYGSRDSFAGSMKGVIARINPAVQVIDISHEIAPQDIWEAAYVLQSSYSDLPRGTIHLAVVDPGVGSGRRPIIVVTESYFFVGPDNGIFSLVYREAERLRKAAVRHAAASEEAFGQRDVLVPEVAQQT